MDHSGSCYKAGRPSARVIPAPTGSIQFMDGSTVLSTVPLGPSGKAACTTSTLTPGSFDGLHALVTGAMELDAFGGSKSAANAARLAELANQTTTT